MARSNQPESHAACGRSPGSPPGPFPVPNATLPFWRTDLHELDSHRSTVELPQQCDVLIIGSGLSGATIAYHILDDNPSPPSMVILEARQACSGATGRNGRWGFLVRSHYQSPLKGALAASITKLWSNSRQVATSSQTCTTVCPNMHACLASRQLPTWRCLR